MNKLKYTILSFLLATCILVSNSNAAVPWNKFDYFLNNGGLNDNLSTTEIKDGEATDIQNITFDTGGALKKRNGFTTVPNNIITKVSTGTTVCVNGLFFYKKDNGNRYLVALTNNDNKATLMKKDYGVNGPNTGAWDNIDAGGLNSSYTNNYQPSFCVAQDVLVFVDGVNTSKPYMWNGSSKALLLTSNANLASGSIVTYHKNQLFVGNSSLWPSRIWFSNLDDIYTWTATDFFDLETSDGTQVRGMIEAFDSLYIFKDKSIWRLGGTNRDDFTLQKMVDGIGSLSNQSIKVVNNLIYFTTAQGDIGIYDGGYNVQFISQKIRGTIGGLAFNRATNTVGLAFSSYKYNDYDYYVSCTSAGQGTNNTVLMFDTAYKAWTKFKGINANCWTVGDNDSAQNAMYFGDYSGYVHTYPSTGYYDGNVSTDAIVAFYQSKWFRYPEVALGDKYWRLLKTYCTSDNSLIYLNAECRADYEASGKVVQIALQSSQSMWDVAYWDVALWGGTTIIVGRNEIEKGTNMFQVKYYNNNVNEGFTIVGYSLFIQGSERI